MSSFQEFENFQNQHCENLGNNEEERELEEALSFSNLPITSIVTQNEDEERLEEKENTTQHEEENLDFNFDFGSLVGSISALDDEMCVADEVFSGGQILPYRNSVSSMSELRSYSQSKSMDCGGYESRSNSIKSYYSSTSSSGSSSSNNTAISAKTVPLVSKTKIRNQFHSYSSPKPQIPGSGVHIQTHTPSIGKKTKMWEVLKLGLVKTPEIELRDLKLRHRTKNFGKSLDIPRNDSSSSNSNSNIVRNNNNKNDRARKSCSMDDHRISNYVFEMQKRKNQQHISGNKIGDKSSGFFKSCKCSIGAINPMPIRQNYHYYGYNSGYFGVSNTNRHGKSQNYQARRQILNDEDKKLAQKERHQQEEQRENKQIRREDEVMSHHQLRTFEWLKNLSHATVLNS